MIFEPLTGQPVWDLQQMLLTISQEYPQIPPVIPDGRFGERTLEAVMVFQRDFGLPVTGVVDNATWDAITRAYRGTMERIGPPIELRVMPDGWYIIQPGEYQEQVAVIQAMFNSLARVLAGFQAVTGDGVNRGATLENVRYLQTRYGAEPTGIIDRPTWSFLARLYHLFITRSKQLA